MIYRGRFAPTPSGPLHFGSLVAAMGSYLEAKRHSGEWWLRIDDLDPPRVQPGAADAILRCLECYGFQWDGPVIYQSRRRAAYHAALHRLRQLGLVYACACTRKEIALIARNSAEGPIYPGTCRAGSAAAGRALRLNTRGAMTEFHDEVQGLQRRDIEHDLGDFVLYRNDAVFSFHIASAVDDGDYAMTHIVRGADLLESSVRQIYLQKLLGYPIPFYMHLPVASNAGGEKLSKQTHAAPLPLDKPGLLLTRALQFLGQAVPGEMTRACTKEIWAWAMAHWERSRIPRESAGRLNLAL
ncbi:MAG: tRNA glutamyl-Q(34) synthetase GluQRS [Burkholderiales bacterium]